MTVWQIILSQLLTNELRLVLGLYFAAVPLEKKTLALAVAGGVAVTGLQGAGLPAAGPAAEVLVLTGLAWAARRGNLRRPLFLFFFYETGVGLWDFLFRPPWASSLGQRPFSTRRPRRGRRASGWCAWRCWGLPWAGPGKGGGSWGPYPGRRSWASSAR